MVVKLYENGYLNKLTEKEVDTIDREVLESEKNAKVDIYNYAAHFDSIPEMRTRTYNSFRWRRKKIYEVMVKLPEQGIEGSGRGRDERSAEIAAALRFKEAAEKYQSEHGTKSLIIKDSTALTTETVRKFLEFYAKLRREKVELRHLKDVDENPTQKSGNTQRAQAFIDSKPIGQAISAFSKKIAEDLALLTAALQLKKKDPSLYPRFVETLRAGLGNILTKVNPVNLSIDSNNLVVMRETLLDARKNGLLDHVSDIGPEAEGLDSRRAHFGTGLTPAELEARNVQLQRAFGRYLSNPLIADLKQKKSELPINQYSAKVLDLVNKNQYSIVVGATGSGKTTQIPQIIIEDAISQGNGARSNVICTQPRRLAAISIAERVAQERAEMLQDTIGYHVRFDKRRPRDGGSITYCTTGVLLQQLRSSPDEVMDFVSHLVIDEVHERDMTIDFLLVTLKKCIASRLTQGKSIPKIVMMSATMNTELFASYFRQASDEEEAVDCPTLSIPGRTFPVKEKYLDEIFNEIQSHHSQDSLLFMRSDPKTRQYFKTEDEFRQQKPIHLPPMAGSGKAEASAECSAIDWKKQRPISSEDNYGLLNEKEDAIVPFGLVAITVAHIAKTTQDGAILVFLPGLREIVNVQELLLQNPLGVDFGDTSKFKLHMLHSSLPGSQPEIFGQVPRGCRKIILATNIAETSITIPDIQYVIDTGKVRLNTYDSLRRITSLDVTWISKSNSKQRSGRAGRVQDGNYYALFSKERHESFRTTGLPEILRSDLQEVCLNVKAQSLRVPIREFLAETIEPPDPRSVDASIKNLIALDTLTENEQLTPLGRLLASLPMHPSLGKMIVLGIIFRCLDPMIVLGVAASVRSLFINPPLDKKAALKSKVWFSRDSDSDHIATLNAVRELRQRRKNQGDFAANDFAWRNLVHYSTFKVIEHTAQQVESILSEEGLIPATAPYRRKNGEYGGANLNENSSKVSLIKALLVSGLHPNLAVAIGRTFRTPKEKHSIADAYSVNQRGRGHGSDSFSYPYGALFSYTSLRKMADGNSTCVVESSESTPLMAALFGGTIAQLPSFRKPPDPLKNQKKNQKNNNPGNIIEMDNWLPFYVKNPSSSIEAATTIVVLRDALDRMLAAAFMDLKTLKKDRDGEYLADDKVRMAFAQSLVEIIERDAIMKQESREQA
ncbi:MAG: hypothetical protein Q9190_006483 [Brigantiaea leucoxantha]